MNSLKLICHILPSVMWLDNKCEVNFELWLLNNCWYHQGTSYMLLPFITRLNFITHVQRPHVVGEKERYTYKKWNDKLGSSVRAKFSGLNSDNHWLLRIFISRCMREHYFIFGLLPQYCDSIWTFCGFFSCFVVFSELKTLNMKK